MNTVSLWELSKQEPRTDKTRNAIAEALGVTWTDLYGVPKGQLSDWQAAEAEAEERASEEQMVKNYRTLTPQHKEIVQGIIIKLIEMEQCSIYNSTENS